MNKCKLCGSYAINPGHNGRKDDNPDLCDVHYFMAQRDELLAALKDARESIEDWAGYASNYFREKHNKLGDELAALDVLISRMEGWE